jgi:hypothetical protein
MQISPLAQSLSLAQSEQTLSRQILPFVQSAEVRQSPFLQRPFTQSISASQSAFVVQVLQVLFLQIRPPLQSAFLWQDPALHEPFVQM